MLGFLKRTLNLFKPSRKESAVVSVEINVPKSVPAPKVRTVPPGRNGSPGFPASPIGGAGLRAPQMQAAPEASEIAEDSPLTLSLKPIVEHLPEDLKAYFSADLAESAQVQLRIPDVVEQLQRGAVKVTFGALRKAAPAGACTLTASTHDRSFVEVPIAIVLPHVKLPRRPNQRKVAISNDDVPQLNLRGNEVVASPSEAESKPAPAPAASTNDGLRLKMDNVPPAEPPKAIPSGPVDGPVVRLSLADLSGVWQRNVIDFLVLNDLEGAMIDIPLRELEPRMREGKVAFLWETLAGWMVPRPAASTFGNPSLPLPLTQITPEFMRVSAEHSTNQSSAPAPATLKMPDSHNDEDELEVCLDIDLEDLSAESASDPTPAAASFTHDSGSPEELVEAACALDGVDGALVSSHDGLSIAARFPDLLDPNVVAAFLPEIMIRTRVYFSEIDLAEPDSMVINTGDRKLVILATGQLFMAFLIAPDTEPSLLRLRGIAERLEELALET